MGVLDTPGISRAQFPAAFSRRKRTSGGVQVKKTVPAYGAGHGWTNSGSNYDTTNSNLNDTTQFDIGSQAIKLVTLGNGGNASVYKVLTAPVDASDCDIRLRFRLTDTNLNSLSVIVGNSTFSAASTAQAFSLNGTSSTVNWPWQTGRWATMDVPRSHFGAGADWTAIQRIQVQVNDKSAVTTLHVAGFEFVKTDPFSKGPVAVWTLDDSSAAQDSVVRPALTAQGWKATVLPIIDLLDTGGCLTTAQVRAMHDTYGWEVGAHAYTNAAHALGMPGLTQAQRISELESILAWQDGYGLQSTSYAWPLGNHDAASDADVANYFPAARMAFAPMVETVNVPRRYGIQCVNVGTQTANLHTLIDRAAAGHGLLVFVVHDVGTASGNNITAATLTDTINYLAASGIPVKTMGEVLSSLVS